MDIWNFKKNFNKNQKNKILQQHIKKVVKYSAEDVEKVFNFLLSENFEGDLNFDVILRSLEHTAEKGVESQGVRSIGNTCHEDKEKENEEKLENFPVFLYPDDGNYSNSHVYYKKNGETYVKKMYEVKDSELNHSNSFKSNWCDLGKDYKNFDYENSELKPSSDDEENPSSDDEENYDSED
jgi:hypothetical protein